jgi:hypothetical protein
MNMKTFWLGLRTNWHFMRWLRLAFGIFIAVYAIRHRDLFSGLLAAFFLFQAFSNTGCCGSTCALPPGPQNREAEKKDPG